MSIDISIEHRRYVCSRSMFVSLTFIRVANELNNSRVRLGSFSKRIKLKLEFSARLVNELGSAHSKKLSLLREA